MRRIVVYPDDNFVTFISGSKKEILKKLQAQHPDKEILVGDELCRTEIDELSNLPIDAIIKKLRSES